MKGRALVLVVLIAATGCVRAGESNVPPLVPAADYERLYPRYVEICAVSQIRSNFAPHGGTPGHAVMYLKGACLDEGAGYPRLRLCDSATSDFTSGETGTGVSVNKLLQNVNWLAFPGRKLFFDGNLEPGQVLDVDYAIATIEGVFERGLYEGVEIHGEFKPPEGDKEQLLYLAAAETLGTDFALRFGRSAFCARLPVTEPVLQEVVAYLNGLNDEYARGEADYNWSGYSDNCAHTLHNALAAAGVWKEQSVRTTKFRQLFNLSVPANEFANLAIRSSSFNIENPWRLYNDPVMRKTLMEQDWLPTRQGALITFLPVHQENELYETEVRIFVLETPLLRMKSRRIVKMGDDPRFTDLEANLRWFERRYERVLAKRPGDWDEEAEEGSYRHFRRRYYRYIERELEDVRRKLVELRRAG